MNPSTMDDKFFLAMNERGFTPESLLQSKKLNHVSFLAKWRIRPTPHLPIQKPTHHPSFWSARASAVAFSPPVTNETQARQRRTRPCSQPEHRSFRLTETVSIKTKQLKEPLRGSTMNTRSPPSNPLGKRQALRWATQLISERKT